MDTVLQRRKGKLQSPSNSPKTPKPQKTQAMTNAEPMRPRSIWTTPKHPAPTPVLTERTKQSPGVSKVSDLASPHGPSTSFTSPHLPTVLCVTEWLHTTCIYLLVSNHILGSHALLMVNKKEQKMLPNDLENQVHTFPKSEWICSKSSQVRSKH